MYAFPILAIPLGYILLAISEFPSEDRRDSRLAFFKGLTVFLPLALIRWALGALLPSVYDSPLLALRDWGQTIFPCALIPAICYSAFYRYGEKLPADASGRRLTAFYAGALTPVGLAESIRIWERPDPFTIFILPVVLASIGLAMPRIIQALRGSFGIRSALIVAAALAASLAASIGRWLFLMRLWPLAWGLGIVIGAGAWALAVPGLKPKNSGKFEQ